MDSSIDAVLSLDELTVEFNDDDHRRLEILFDEHQVIKHDVFGQENQLSNNKNFDEDGGRITKEILQVDSHQDIPEGYMTNLKTIDSQQIETLEQAINPEDDIAILSILKQPKVIDSSDSDSEFEVPDRPVITLVEKADVHSFKHAAEISQSETLTASRSAENNVEFTTIPLTTQSSPPKQAILPSHDDFTLFHQSSNTLPMSTTSSNNLISKPEIVSPANISGDFVKDEEKTSQDSYPKIDLINNGAHSNQNQSSEGTVMKQMPFVGNTIEDSSKDTEEPFKLLITTTAEDWDDVQTIEPGYLQSGEKHADPGPRIEIKPLAPFADTWALFAAADYSSVKLEAAMLDKCLAGSPTSYLVFRTSTLVSQIKTHVERHGLSALKHLIFGPPKLHRDLLSQRDLIFCIAATQFDNANEVHNRVLQTIYRSLTGSKFDCQRFGGHWEEIGFQGRDPATDLRGTGMLSLLHLLYFLQSPCTKDLAKDVYKLSLHPTQNFPFCLMGINLSRISLQVLREGVFNRECNNNRDVPSTVNNVYSALFLCLYRDWKKGKTIADSGFVLQDIETQCRKHSKAVLKDLAIYEKTRKQDVSRKDSDAEMAFYNVCKEDKTDGKSQANYFS